MTDDLKAQLVFLETVLDDDRLAETIGRNCHDPAHDDRWCATCEARLDGINAYRDGLIETAKLMFKAIPREQVLT